MSVTQLFSLLLSAYPLQQQQHQQQQQQQQHQQQLQYQKPHQQQSLKQSQQQQQQQQQHKYTPAAPTAPTALTTSTTSTAATSEAAAAATQQAAAAATATRQQHLPLVHYNPIYVQAPPEQQNQLQKQQHQFTILPRFSNNNPKAVYNMAHESAAPAPSPIHVVRLSPANGAPIHHYHHYQPTSMLQPLYAPHIPQQYVSSYGAGDEGHKSQAPVAISGSGPLLAGPTPSPLMTAGSQPAIIPYFSHPGAVHYGTHLYHPGAATALGATAATSGAGAAGPGPAGPRAAGPRVAGPKQQSTATSGGQLPGDSNNIVKYP